MTISKYSVGTAPSTTPYSSDPNSSWLDGTYTEDHYSFDIAGESSINLNLHNITSGDNADLSLYHDYNGNGDLDPGEPALTSSNNLNNADDSINLVAGAGHYIATVRYGTGSVDRLDYELDLSATSIAPLNAREEPPNLLSREFVVGPLQAGSTSFSEAVGAADSVDTYAFSLGLYQAVEITLSGLTEDADIRLMRDDGNQIVDLNIEEYIAGSSAGSTIDESVDLELSGDYFLQVYQYTGNTTYNLVFDQSSTAYA